MQLGSTSKPRSAKSSATWSYARGYRRYHRTHRTITSPGNWRPLNGLVGVIGMDFYPTRLASPTSQWNLFKRLRLKDAKIVYQDVDRRETQNHRASPGFGTQIATIP